LATTTLATNLPLPSQKRTFFSVSNNEKLKKRGIPTMTEIYKQQLLLHLVFIPGPFQTPAFPFEQKPARVGE
jgi:hypothetical protein